MQALFSQLEIARPVWLAALVLVPLVMYGSRRSLTGFSPARQAASLACRVLLVVALVLGLSEIRLRGHTAERYLVVAVDRSESIADESRAAADGFVDRLTEAAGRGRVAVVPFAQTPLTADERARLSDSDWRTEATNLAAAIELGAVLGVRGSVPEIVLLSDGLETEGDALGAARAAGVPISTVPLQARAEPEVYVSAVAARDRVRQGEPFAVEVVLEAGQEAEGAVQLLREGELVDAASASVVPGENRVRFVQSIASEGPLRFTARIEKFADTLVQNNAASAVVIVTARPRVLLVESESQSTPPLAAALRGEGIDVEVRPPGDLGASPGDLEDYELVVLSNVPAAALSPAQMEVVRSYVSRSGGGLIAVGGDRAFTPGGYRGTALEEVLPLRCEAESTDRRPSMALVLVIDRSESMNEGRAIELAKEATRRAVGLLEARDRVGVIAFQDFPQWISPLHPCSDKGPVLASVDTITAGGGTNMYPAVERAYLALREAPADRKHVIVLTDGVSHPADFDALAARMAEADITVSTVAVGPEAVRPLLDDVARIGKGHSYYCDTAEAVPDIFALETQSAGKMGVHEQPFRAGVQSPLDALSGVDLAGAPSLLGYVETKPKPESKVVMTSERGDPLLVWWRYGRGIAVAFTSDVRSRWAAAWLRWPDFGRFWAQLARHAMRKDRTEGFTLGVEHRNRRTRVTFDAVDGKGRFVNGAEVALTVVDPEENTRPVAVDQVAPGRYAAEFSTPGPGVYLLEASVRHQGRVVYERRRAWATGYAEEYRTRAADEELLRSIAEVTGGRYDPSPERLASPSDRTVPRTTPLWPYLLATAAAIFAIDVAVRRLPWPDARRN